jgi:molybdopterin molybdotransferase
MDGFAVCSADLQEAAPERPVGLECIAKIPAGKALSGTIGSGQCARIFTGSPLPMGADAVVMQEDTRFEGPQVHVLEPVKPWENVRFCGEDVKQGSAIARAGERVTPQMAALFSACGVCECSVRGKLRVAILATGNELKEAGADLSGGEIYESNRVLMATLVRGLGMDAIVKPIVADERGATGEAIREACKAADALITCGGVSVGEYDFVKAAVSEVRGKINFWRVAIKPGKPFVYATVFGKPLFGLPGNPVSALVTFWVLVRPALLTMAGARDVEAAVSWGKLAEEVRNPGDRRHFVRVRIDEEGNVRVSGPQASHRLGSLAAANGLIDVAAGATFESGRLVKVIRLD